MYITFSGPTSRRNMAQRPRGTQRLDVADRAADLEMTTSVGVASGAAARLISFVMAY